MSSEYNPASRVGQYYPQDANIKNIRVFGSPALRAQQSSAVVATGAAMSAANLLNGIITVDTSGGAGNVQLPLCSALDTAIGSSVYTGMSFQFQVVQHAHAANAATIITNTGWTILTLAAVTVVGGRIFTAIRTGAGAWSLF